MFWLWSVGPVADLGFSRSNKAPHLRCNNGFQKIKKITKTGGLGGTLGDLTRERRSTRVQAAVPVHEPQPQGMPEPAQTSRIFATETIHLHHAITEKPGN